MDLVTFIQRPIYVCTTGTHTHTHTHTQAGPSSAVGSASDSKARGSEFDTRPGHRLLFLLLLIEEGQLSVTGKSVCTNYLLTASEEI